MNTNFLNLDYFGHFVPWPPEEASAKEVPLFPIDDPEILIIYEEERVLEPPIPEWQQTASAVKEQDTRTEEAKAKKREAWRLCRLRAKAKLDSMKKEVDNLRNRNNNLRVCISLQLKEKRELKINLANAVEIIEKLALENQALKNEVRSLKRKIELLQ